MLLWRFASILDNNNLGLRLPHVLILIVGWGLLIGRIASLVGLLHEHVLAGIEELAPIHLPITVDIHSLECFVSLLLVDAPGIIHPGEQVVVEVGDLVHGQVVGVVAVVV